MDCCSVQIINKKYNPCHVVMVRRLIYHPSNSKKGFAIKGTNLRVEWIYNYGL